MTNQTGAIELLREDHRTIESLVDRFDATDDPAEIRHLYMEIAELLSAHEAAEQQVIFPTLRAMVGNDPSVARRQGEHEEIDGLLGEMRLMSPDDFAFTKRESAFVLEIKEHFRREEETVFARLDEMLTPEDQAALAERVTEAKRHAPAFPGRSSN